MYIDVAYSLHSVIRTPYSRADIVDAIDLHKVRISACLQPHPGTSLSATPESLTFGIFRIWCDRTQTKRRSQNLTFSYTKTRLVESKWRSIRIESNWQKTILGRVAKIRDVDHRRVNHVISPSTVHTVRTHSIHTTVCTYCKSFYVL